MRLWRWIKQPMPAPVNLDSVQVDQGYKQYKAFSQLLDRNAHWIVVADTRAGLILVFLVAVFPLLAAPALSRVQKVVQATPQNTNFWAYLPMASFIALLVLFLVAVLVTLLQVLIVLLPRVRRADKSGLVFFGDVASQDYKQWQQRILELSPQMLALQVLEQVYVTACIVDRKHKHLRQAIRVLTAAILLGFMLYVLSQLVG